MLPLRFKRWIDLKFFVYWNNYNGEMLLKIFVYINFGNHKGREKKQSRLYCDFSSADEWTFWGENARGEVKARESVTARGLQSAHDRDGGGGVTLMHF